MTDRTGLQRPASFIVELCGETPLFLTIDARGATFSRVSSEGLVDLYLTSRRSEVDLRALLLDNLQPWQKAQHLLVRTPESEWSRHPPYDLTSDGWEASTPGLNLVVQHVKRGSPVGDLRYIDTFVDGALVGRSGGVTSRADAAVRNTFVGMVAAFDDGDPLENLGHAEVRAREKADLLLMAGLYSDAEFLRRARRSNIANTRLAQLSIYLGGRTIGSLLRSAEGRS